MSLIKERVSSRAEAEPVGSFSHSCLVAGMREHLDRVLEEGWLEEGEEHPKGLQNLDWFLHELLESQQGLSVSVPVLSLGEDGEVVFLWESVGRDCYLRVNLETGVGRWSVHKDEILQPVDVREMLLAKGSGGWTTLRLVLEQHHGSRVI